MKSNNLLKFDKDEFYRWCNDKGLTKSEVSKNLGFNEGYLVKCANRGSIPVPSYKLLISEYGIEYGRFLVTENEPKEESQVSDEVQNTYAVKLLELQVSLLDDIKKHLSAMTRELNINVD